MCVDVTEISMCSRVDCSFIVRLFTDALALSARKLQCKSFLIEIFKPNQKRRNCYICPKKLVREKLVRTEHGEFPSGD